MVPEGRERVNPMRILLGTDHLVKTGGTENYTYALAVELKNQGHEVEYFAFNKGDVAKRLEKKGIHFMSQEAYDVILANHTTVVRHLYGRGFTIQTCHGLLPALEQPSLCADMHVAISGEIRDHIEELGMKAIVIKNGIDTKRFFSERPLPDKLSTVLSLCQSKEANEFIKACCNRIGVRLLVANKFKDNVWSVEKLINQADLVVGIGRSAYDAMACGRCVVSFDYRPCVNPTPMGDGFLDASIIEKSEYHNCIGRATKRSFTEDEFVKELQKYDPAVGAWMREYALRRHNITTAVDEYLSLAQDGTKQPQTEREKYLVEEFEAEVSTLKQERDHYFKKNKKHMEQLRLLSWTAVVLLVLLLMSVAYVWLIN